jgi:tight adherence protein C
MVGRQLARAELDAFIETRTWAALSLLCLLLAASLAAALCLLLPVQAAAYMVAVALGVLLAPWLWLLERGKRIRLSVQHDLPACLDTLTLALEAGCAFGAALQLMVERSAEAPLRRAWQRCQQEMRAGRPRREALERLGQRLAVPALSATVAAIIQAELTGVSLAPVIRAQAVRGTQERFARAEKRALEAPIRMLAPLVICIFPCTFIVIGFPIAATLLWGA